MKNDLFMLRWGNPDYVTEFLSRALYIDRDETLQSIQREITLIKQER
ncbi:MAG: hypothetical protein MI748_14555 [Opitutales bacterium]|nr:hypothetical protein [Opitutales bacterium]